MAASASIGLLCILASKGRHLSTILGLSLGLGIPLLVCIILLSRSLLHRVCCRKTREYNHVIILNSRDPYNSQHRRSYELKLWDHTFAQPCYFPPVLPSPLFLFSFFHFPPIPSLPFPTPSG